MSLNNQTDRMSPSPDFDRAAAEAARLHEPTPVTRRTELQRLADVRPDLAARLDDLAGRILAEGSRARRREHGELRTSPASTGRVAYRLPQQDQQPR